MVYQTAPFSITLIEQPHTHISRSGHYLTLNICEMAADIVSMEGE